MLSFLCAQKTTDSQQKHLYQALNTWKNTFVKESLAQRCIIHGEKNSFYQERITFEETEAFSLIRKCRDNSTCVQWKFLKDAKVIEYDESNTNALVIIQIDVESFVYIRTGNRSFLPSNASEKVSLGTFKTIKAIQHDSKTKKQIDLHKMSPEMLTESWYSWTELVLEDTRVQNYLERERIVAERKYLELPFIQHFSLTDGKFN